MNLENWLDFWSIVAMLEKLRTNIRRKIKETTKRWGLTAVIMFLAKTAISLIAVVLITGISTILKIIFVGIAAFIAIILLFLFLFWVNREHGVQGGKDGKDGYRD